MNTPTRYLRVPDEAHHLFALRPGGVQQPDSVLGDLISAYIQYTGNNATYIENLVRDVEHLRAARGAADLESKLNDAYYERDCLRDELEALRAEGGAQ